MLRHWLQDGHVHLFKFTMNIKLFQVWYVYFISLFYTFAIYHLMFPYNNTLKHLLSSKLKYTASPEIRDPTKNPTTMKIAKINAVLLVVRWLSCDLVGALAGTSVGALVWLDFKVFTGSSLIMSMYIWSILSRRTRTRSRLRSKDMINHITILRFCCDNYCV